MAAAAAKNQSASVITTMDASTVLFYNRLCSSFGKDQVATAFVGHKPNTPVTLEGLTFSQRTKDVSNLSRIVDLFKSHAQGNYLGILTICGVTGAFYIPEEVKQPGEFSIEEWQSRGLKKECVIGIKPKKDGEGFKAYARPIRWTDCLCGVPSRDVFKYAEVVDAADLYVKAHYEDTFRPVCEPNQIGKSKFFKVINEEDHTVQQMYQAPRTVCSTIQVTVEGSSWFHSLGSNRRR